MIGIIFGGIILLIVTISIITAVIIIFSIGKVLIEEVLNLFKD